MKSFMQYVDDLPALRRFMVGVLWFLPSQKVKRKIIEAERLTINFQFDLELRSIVSTIQQLFSEVEDDSYSHEKVLETLKSAEAKLSNLEDSRKESLEGMESTEQQSKSTVAWLKTADVDIAECRQIVSQYRNAVAVLEKNLSTKISQQGLVTDIDKAIGRVQKNAVIDIYTVKCIVVDLQIIKERLLKIVDPAWWSKTLAEIDRDSVDLSSCAQSLSNTLDRFVTRFQTKRQEFDDSVTNPYYILGIPRNTQKAEITSAYN